MIQHIVVIKWKPETADEQIAAALQEAHRLTDAIAGRRGARWRAARLAPSG